MMFDYNSFPIFHVTQCRISFFCLFFSITVYNIIRLEQANKFPIQNIISGT